jgi:ADP-ribose pyrophosphatase
MDVTVHDEVEIHRGKVFALLRERVTLPNGVETDIERIEHPGASAIVPVLNDGQVVLIRQYRHAVRSHIWEIPAGTLSANEEPLMCARRELEEETGYRAGSFERLGEIVPVPGYSNERIHIFLATELSPAESALERDEVIEIHIVPLGEAVSRTLSGHIVDAKTIIGLMWAWQRVRDKDE